MATGFLYTNPTAPRSDTLSGLAIERPIIEHHTRQRSLEDLQLDESFHLFPKLPIELRLLIWEFSWPEPRIIEATNTEHDMESIEYTGITSLRLTAPLPALLRMDFGGNRLLSAVKPLEQCSPPSSLQVCLESREHTLIHYHIMQHSESTHSFFFNPSRDILWPSRDLNEEPGCRRNLESYYGGQLDKFWTVLVEEAEWNYFTPARYTSDFLAIFKGVKTIVLVYGDYDEATGSLITEAKANEYYARAEKLRMQFVELLRNGECQARTLQYMDRNGRFY